MVTQKSRPIHSGAVRFLATPNYHWEQFLTSQAETNLGAGSDSVWDYSADDVSYETIIKNPDHAFNTDGIIDIKSVFGIAANGAQVAFYGTSTDGDTAGIEILAWKEGKYMQAKPVCKTTAGIVLGTAVVQKEPITGASITNGLWADTISVTDYWPTGVTIGDSGNNQVATLHFDLMGYRYLQINTVKVNGGVTAGEADTFGAIVTAY